MATTVLSNKDVVTQMYEIFLNQKRFDVLGEFIAPEYVDAFGKANTPLLSAFPDIYFEIKEILAEGNKVITIYEWRGTHKHEYQKIPATNEQVSVEGISIYELQDGKITSSMAKPDKLAFFLQLGVITSDFIKK